MQVCYILEDKLSSNNEVTQWIDRVDLCTIEVLRNLEVTGKPQTKLENTPDKTAS